MVTIGWTGNVLVHPYDLQEMGSGLQQALDRTKGKSQFVVLGQKWDARQRLLLSEEPSEVLWKREVDDYVAAVGELFDVGIAPLRLDRFNNAKSWLKPLEYSARGVFCVRARTSEYERLGLGLPARSAKDWAKWLTGGRRGRRPPPRARRRRPRQGARRPPHRAHGRALGRRVAPGAHQPAPGDAPGRLTPRPSRSSRRGLTAGAPPPGDLRKFSPDSAQAPRRCSRNTMCTTPQHGCSGEQNHSKEEVP